MTKKKNGKLAEYFAGIGAFVLILNVLLSNLHKSRRIKIYRLLYNQFIYIRTNNFIYNSIPEGCEEIGDYDMKGNVFLYVIIGIIAGLIVLSILQRFGLI